MEGECGGQHVRNAWRVLNGNNSRFSLLKGSIAARKTTTSNRVSRDTGHSQPEISRENTVPGDAGATGTVHSGAESYPTLHSPIVHRPNGEHSPCTEMLLGPMGSFKELPRVSSAADLIRSASHDYSSHSQSQARDLRLANVSEAYVKVERTGYYRPSDRIGHLYTSTAAALTSSSAQSVAKSVAALVVARGMPVGSVGSDDLSRPGVRGGSIVESRVVTAPSAADSREILQQLALQPASCRVSAASLTSPTAAGYGRASGGNQSPSPKGEQQESFASSEQVDSLLSTNDEAAVYQAHGESGCVGDSDGRTRFPSSRSTSLLLVSDQDRRTQRRDMRSPPPDRRVVEVSSPKRWESGHSRIRDFSSWNPAILDENTSLKRFPVAESSSGCGRDPELAAYKQNITEAELQEKSIKGYWAMVEEKMEKGSPNALGAGAMSQIIGLPVVRLGESVEYAQC